jgi:cysteine synthase
MVYINERINFVPRYNILIIVSNVLNWSLHLPPNKSEMTLILIDISLLGFGTGGAITGVSTVIKMKNK